MDFLLTGLAQHGYSILFAAVFLETVGLPIPAAIALLIAGGASARGSLRAPLALGGSFAAALFGDTLMFFLGRYTGWWLLGLLCRLSLNPESCMLRSADAFYKRGRSLLVFAKFVPGINTMAPPLAGSMNMRWTQFTALDAVGAALYIGTYWSVGFLFSDAVEAITHTMRTFSRIVEGALIAALAAYVGYLAWTWIKSNALRSIPRIHPSQAAQAMSTEGAIIYDVRSHGYYDQKAQRIQGSKRFEPHALHQEPLAAPAAGQPVYLYCTCVRDATSARVAKELIGQGVNVSVIQGGLRAWKKAGLPLESVPSDEIEALPAFDVNRSKPRRSPAAASESRRPPLP
jgi:membrane protein DedA with SNARE-associated domain/rhodanese-related sulfurtransferase